MLRAQEADIFLPSSTIPVSTLAFEFAFEFAEVFLLLNALEL